jgi:hypothetical protein
MPATGSGNKPQHVEAAQERRRRRSPRHTKRKATPSPVDIARAQARQYASQGRSVERQANLQRARNQPRAGGDDKGAHEFERAQAYVRGLYERQKRGIRDPNARPVQNFLLAPGARLYQPNTTVPPDVRARTGRRDLEQGAKEAAVSAPAVTILEQLTRPIHALAATERQAIREFKEGSFTPGDLGDLASAFGRGISNKEKSLTSDVLGDLGFPEGKVRSALGFTGDVFGDPTTYLSFGATTVARKSAEQAARKATEQALKKGASKKVADKAGRAAAREALEKAPKNRGLTVGFGSKRTSGKTTARAIEKTGASKGAERLRGGLPGRMLRHVAPRMRPAGVTAAEWERVRAAIVRGRAATSTGEHRARNVAQAIARALPGDDHSKIIDALEELGSPRMAGKVAGGSGPPAGLTETERKVVQALAKEYDDIYRAEHGRNLVGRKFRDFGYFPRRPISELEPGGSRRRMSGAQLASSKARTNRQRYSEFRGGEDDVYTKNAAVATYLRGRDSAVKIGRKIVIDELHSVGRRFHPGAALKDGEAVYKFSSDGRKMPMEVERDELKSLMGGGAPPGQNEYRILNRDVVRAADQSVPSKLEDLEEIGRIWDRQVQGRVKTVLTVINPQYHLTNMYGDLWKAYTEVPAFTLLRNLGVSAQALKWKAKREAASKTFGKVVDPTDKGITVDGRKMTFADSIKEAEDHGAISQGFIARDLADTLDAQGKEAAERMGRGKIAKRTKVGQRVAASKVGSRVLHPIDTVRDASQYREDWVRYAVYVGRRRKGDSPDQAADFANRTLIDYGDLSTFERSVLRRIAPFYTFTARNTPQQVSALFRRPGKFANLEKAREEALKASGLPDDYQDQIRDFEQRGIPIPLPGKDGKMLFPKLPAMDLNRLTVSDQGDYMVAMLTPILKVPIEWDQNYSFFFRDKIDQLIDEKGPNGETVRQLKPAPKWLISAVQKLPYGEKLTDALHIRPYKDKRTGKTVMGWPAKLDYLLKQTPLSGTALQFGTDVPNTRGQTQEQRLLGYLTGLKVAPFEEKAISERKLGQEYGYLQAKAKAMRDQGDAYDAKGERTPDYQEVLDRTRVVGKELGVYDKRKKPSILSPEAQAALDGLRSSDGPLLSPEAKAALEALKP